MVLNSYANRIERMEVMFEKGQYVNYGKHGVCVVEDITHMDIPGVSKDKLYYDT